MQQQQQQQYHSPALSSSQGEIESRGKVVVSPLMDGGMNMKVKKTMDILGRHGGLRSAEQQQQEQQQQQQWEEEGEMMVGVGVGKEGGREGGDVSGMVAPSYEEEEDEKDQQQPQRQQQQQQQQQQQLLEHQLLSLQQEHRSLLTRLQAAHHGAKVLGEEAARANEELERRTGTREGGREGRRKGNVGFALINNNNMTFMLFVSYQPSLPPSFPPFAQHRTPRETRKPLLRVRGRNRQPASSLD